MTKFHLDKHFSKFSDIEVFFGIKYFTSSKNKDIEIPLHHQLLYIADLIGHIKNEGFLKNTIHYLKWLGWFEDETQIANILFEVDGLRIYDKADGIKIKALAYNALFKYELSCKLRSGNITAGVKNLVFKCRGRKFSHNADDLISESIVLSLGEMAKSLSPNHRNNMLTFLVDYYSQEEFDKGDKLASRARKYFYNLKQNYSLNSSFKKSYPLISHEVSEPFTKYIRQHIVEPYVDHSYLFQRLKYEKLLASVKHQEFVKWLLESGHITPTVHNLLMDKGFFRSLSKSTSPQRENNFNNLFDEILSNSTDFRLSEKTAINRN